MNELGLYETPLLVDVEESCGELADCAVCITGGGSEAPAGGGSSGGW